MQKTIYVGEGNKFSDSMRPFPLSPPVLNLDPTEYGEFVLPEIKVLTAEEISTKLNECFDELFAKFDEDGEGAMPTDAVKALTSEVKGRINGNDGPMDLNEEGWAAMEAKLPQEDK